MKKFFTLTVVVLASIRLAQVVSAGPEPTGKEMKQVAPLPPAGCFDWSGPYVGAFGGYKFSSVDLNLNLNGDWNREYFADAQHFGESAGSGDLNNDGGEVGGVMGYNWQFNCWVVGVEGAGGYLFARKSSDSGTFFPNETYEESFDFHVRSSFQTHFLFTLAPRIGYAFGNWLPYVTGGLAVGDLDFSQHVDLLDGPNEGGRDREVNAGWMVGGGLQYALNAHWSVRAQYQFIDLGSVHFNSDFHGEVPWRLSDFPANHQAELREHNASFAIIYKF